MPDVTHILWCQSVVTSSAAILASLLSGCATADDHRCVETVDPNTNGCFLTHLDLRAIGPRDFVLLEAFEYRDPRGRLWLVPKGAKVDGASIPRYLWVVGSPWVGGYRRASVIHDYFFDRPDVGSDDVHRVFYEAMLAGGVNAIQARLMYYAVSNLTEQRKPKRTEDEAGFVQIGGRSGVGPDHLDSASDRGNDVFL